MSRKRERSKKVAEAIAHMYATMASAAAKQAVNMAGSSLFSFADAQARAANAEDWADRAGANAIHWRLSV